MAPGRGKTADRMPRKMVEAFVCNRCEHWWVPRSEQLPKVCPKCKSPYWDTPRTRPVPKKDPK